MSYITWRMGIIYENDPKRFPDEVRYRVLGGKVAWYVLGWEVEPDNDTDWSGMYNRTGNVLAVRVGDDRAESMDPDDLQPIDDYCPSCGQVGCHVLQS